jgi:hypothetical protein
VTMPQIRKMAKQMGVKASSRSRKADLIRQIQSAEGNFDCFGTALGDCDRRDCLWRQDCLGRR